MPGRGDRALCHSRRGGHAGGGTAQAQAPQPEHQRTELDEQRQQDQQPEYQPQPAGALPGPGGRRGHALPGAAAGLVQRGRFGPGGRHKGRFRGGNPGRRGLWRCFLRSGTGRGGSLRCFRRRRFLCLPRGLPLLCRQYICRGRFTLREVDALPFQDLAGHTGRIAQFRRCLFLPVAARRVEIFLVIVQGLLPFLCGQGGQQFLQPGQIGVLPHSSSPLNSLLILPV